MKENGVMCDDVFQKEWAPVLNISFGTCVVCCVCVLCMCVCVWFNLCMHFSIECLSKYMSTVYLFLYEGIRINYVCMCMYLCLCM